MKKFALKHPSVTALIAFLIVSIGGTLLGFIWGLSIMWRNPCEPISPSDPCDGAAMAAGMIWSLTFAASIVLGGIVSLIVFGILQRIAKSPEKMP
jgi:hypothetical protein